LVEVQIVVRGRLSDRFAARFDGLALQPGPESTTLAGDLVDQAQLHGVLDRIRELGLELLAVEARPAPAADR
jgi:hypothetical protein